MNKSLRLTIAAFGLAFLNVSTATVRAQDYTYTTNEGTITIIGYLGPGGAVTIPSTITGLPVTSIGPEAFAGRTAVTSVAIPENVAEIGRSAFNGCTNLARITVPRSVLSIGETVLYHCDNLAAIDVDPQNLGYTSLEGVLFNKNLSTLIQYPAGKSGSYIIPDNVTTIVDLAFAWCAGLTNITIPNSVTNFTSTLFSGCIGLVAVMVDPLNPSLSSKDGVLFNKTQTILMQYPMDKPGTSYAIPSTVATIGQSAFEGCKNLTRVTLPNSVTTIEDWAFCGGAGLTNITMSPSVTSLGSAAFQGCASLTTITIPDGVTAIADYTFSWCTALTNVSIGNSVTSVGTFAFAYCSNLTSLTLPESLGTIGDGAFVECASLSAIYFMGDAPSAEDWCLDPFSGATNATIRYLPGTRGWDSTFSGRPTAFWALPAPLILNRGPGFGFQTNQFGFIVSWATNLSVVVDASTSVTSSHWVPLSTNALNNGWFYFRDTESTNHPSRFYRVRTAFTRAVLDDFNDNLIRNWVNLSSNGRGGIYESNQQFTVRGYWPGQHPTSVFQCWAKGWLPKPWTVADGQTLEWRVDLVEMNESTSMVNFIPGSWSPLGGYSLSVGRGFVAVAKVTSSNSYTAVVLAYDKTAFTETNIILSLALTRMQTYLVIETRVLDKDNEQNELYHRRVVDTPLPDPSLTTAEFKALTGMNLAFGPDLQQTPLFSGDNIALEIFQCNDGTMPAAVARFDNLELRTYKAP